LIVRIRLSSEKIRFNLKQLPHIHDEVRPELWRRGRTFGADPGHLMQHQGLYQPPECFNDSESATSEWMG